MIRTIVVAGALSLALLTLVSTVHPATLVAQNMAPDSHMAPINLNVATPAELERLPGVGPAMAARIVEYRQKNGGFKKIEDLMNVKGIGEKTFLRLKPLVTVTPAKATEK